MVLAPPRSYRDDGIAESFIDFKLTHCPFASALRGRLKSPSGACADRCKLPKIRSASLQLESVRRQAGGLRYFKSDFLDALLETVKKVSITWSFRVQRGISHATHIVICGICRPRPSTSPRVESHCVRNDEANAFSDFFHSLSENRSQIAQIFGFVWGRIGFEMASFGFVSAKFRTFPLSAP